VKGVWLCLRRVRVSCLVQWSMAPSPTLWTLVLFAPPDLLLPSAVHSVPPVSLGPSAPQPADHPAPPVLLEATAALANRNAPFVTLEHSILHPDNQLVQHVMPGLSTPQPEATLH
jgi:hypothetical protein